MTGSVVRTLDTRDTNLRGAQRVRTKKQAWSLGEYGTHNIPLCRYPTESAEWLLWILHEVECESNDKSQRAYVSILCHAKVSSCRTNG
jgi:hypothetical protein